MNITAFSPALTLCYVFILLCILMGVDIRTFERKKRWLVLTALFLLCAVNHLLFAFIGPVIYNENLLFPCLHLPAFLLFLYIAKRGIIKTAFMILTGLVFTAPSVLISNLFNRTLNIGSYQFLIDLICYTLLLLLAWFVFRKSFNYLIVHGTNQFFLLFSLVPVAFYAYAIIGISLDVSAISSPVGFLFRWLPTAQVFLFYFLLPYIYTTLREKMLMQSAQTRLELGLSSAEHQISLLNEANTQMAVYRHDVRHQAILLNGLLAGGNTEQAQEFLKTAIAGLDAITPKRYCENETVNLLCSSYDSKTKRLGVQLKVNAQLPKEMPLSDTELCSVVSNGLENALRATSQTEVAEKWIDFSCYVRKDKIFMQIQNPYTGEVIIRNGLPISSRVGHGYGCYSIQAITQRNGGLCSFEAKDGLFSLRLSFPLHTESSN